MRIATLIGLVVAVAWFGCATVERVVVPRPTYKATGSGLSLAGTRLDGAYLYIAPVIDLRRAEPEDFGRSEDSILALSGVSVADVLRTYAAGFFRKVGLLVKTPQGTPNPTEPCAFVLTIRIERFWVLAEPLAADGVADTYRYFIALRATLKRSDGKVVFKGKRFELTEEVARKDIDPFLGSPPNSAYLVKLHRNALLQIFNVHYVSILSELWDTMRTNAYCEDAKDNELPKPYIE